MQGKKIDGRLREIDQDIKYEEREIQTNEQSMRGYRQVVRVLTNVQRMLTRYVRRRNLAMLTVIDKAIDFYAISRILSDNGTVSDVDAIRKVTRIGGRYEQYNLQLQNELRDCFEKDTAELERQWEAEEREEERRREQLDPTSTTSGAADDYFAQFQAQMMGQQEPQVEQQTDELDRTLLDGGNDDR